MQNKWIPTTESLPKFNKPVLAAVKTSNGELYLKNLMLYGKVDGYLWLGSVCHGDIANPNIYDYDCDASFDVKYWMEFPELPEVKK